jgi:ketosteroid isomerase-like protein
MEILMLRPPMLYRSAAVALGLLAVIGMAGPPLLQDPATVQLLQLEDAWGKAEVAKDGDAIGRLLATDFLSIGADGVISDRAQYIAWIRANQSEYVSAADSDRIVRVYGNTAVDIGLWTETVKRPHGTETSRYRWSSVWVKQPTGEWRCVSTQTVLVPSVRRE